MLLVELVGTHDPADVIAPVGLIVLGDAGPEAGGLQQDFRAVVVQELQVVRAVEVLPHRVGHRDRDVALPAGEIRVPLSRDGVEVQDLGLFVAVVGGLPGIHGPPVAVLAGVLPGPLQAAVAVQQERPADVRKVEVVEGVDEQLVPEDVPPVGLAVEAPGGQARVDAEVVGTGRAQQVIDVQAQHPLGEAVSLDHDVRLVPQGPPGPGMLLEKLVEAPPLAQRILRGLPWIRNVPVPGGVQAYGLLQGVFSALFGFNAEALGDVPGVLIDRALRLQGLRAAEPGGPGPEEDIDLRAHGSRLQKGAALPLADPDRLEVPGVQLPVAGHPVVGHGAVEAGAHGKAPGPVHGADRVADRPQVGVVHARDPAAFDRRDPAFLVLEGQRALHHGFAQTQGVPVVQDLHVQGAAKAGSARRQAVADSQLDRQPVRAVDQIVVDDRLAVDHAREAVVHPGNVRARVVDHLIGPVALEGPPGAEVAVAHRGQCLPQALSGGLEAVVAQGPAVLFQAAGEPALEPLPGQLAEVPDHNVRPMGAKRTLCALEACVRRRVPGLPRLSAGHPDDQGKVAPPAGLDPGDRVLDHQALRRVHAQVLRRHQEDVRIRLALEAHVPGRPAPHDGVELSGQAALLQDEAAVHARGGDSEPGPLPLELPGKREGRFVHLYAVPGDDLLEQGVLPVAQSAHGFPVRRI